jgi:hypothetical protein
MMTIGKRNFMDSSKDKRRAPHSPRCGMAGHGTEKIKMRIFADISARSAKIFASLARLGRQWRTVKLVLAQVPRRTKSRDVPLR